MVVPEARKMDLRAVVLDVVHRLTFGCVENEDHGSFAVTDISACEGKLREIAASHEPEHAGDFRAFLEDVVFTFETKTTEARDCLNPAVIGPSQPKADRIGAAKAQVQNEKRDLDVFCFICEREAAARFERSKVFVRLWTKSAGARPSPLRSWLDVQTRYADVGSSLRGNLLAVKTEVGGIHWSCLLWVGFPEQSSRRTRRALSSRSVAKRVGLGRSELFVSGQQEAAWKTVREDLHKRLRKSWTPNPSVLCSALVWKDKLKEPLFVACDVDHVGIPPVRRKRAVDLFLGHDPVQLDVEEPEHAYECGIENSEDELPLPRNLVARFLNGPL